MCDGILTAESSMKKLTIRLPDELSKRITELARENQRSVNRQVIWLIEQAVKVEEKKK